MAAALALLASCALPHVAAGPELLREVRDTAQSPPMTARRILGTAGVDDARATPLAGPRASEAGRRKVAGNTPDAAIYRSSGASFGRD